MATTLDKKNAVHVPAGETRLVVVEYDGGNEHAVEAEGVLAPNSRGEQTLFVHKHLVSKGKLPLVTSVRDVKTGQLIRVSESWLR